VWPAALHAARSLATIADTRSARHASRQRAVSARAASSCDCV
jgi:hypothetical protein